MEEHRRRISKLVKIINGNGDLGLTGRTTMIEKYIANLEEERKEDRQERKRAVWGNYVAIIILVLQTLFPHLNL